MRAEGRDPSLWRRQHPRAYIACVVRQQNASACVIAEGVVNESVVKRDRVITNAWAFHPRPILGLGGHTAQSTPGQVADAIAGE